MGGRTGFSDRREQASPLPPGPKNILREYLELILIFFVLFLFLRTFVFQQSEIPTGSMEDTILIGDYVLVNRFMYGPTLYDWERRWLPVREIRRGDVVVFKHPPEPEQDYVKRVVGLPGEIIELSDGYLYVDGEVVDEPYVRDIYRQADLKKDFGPVEVLPDHFYMLGDHRNKSRDSRYWEQVPRSLLKGRAFIVLFSTHAAPDADSPGRVTARALITKVYNLLFRSRWDRCFLGIR